MPNTYCNEWLDHSPGEFFPEEDQIRHLFTHVASFFYGQVLPQIDNAVHTAVHEGGSVTKDQLKRIAREAIGVIHKDLKKHNKLLNIPEDYEQGLVTNYQETLDQAISLVFEKLPLGKQERQRLREIGVFLVSRDIFPNNVSGVVIAGFGNRDRYPVLRSFDVDGVVGNTLKYRTTQEHRVNTTETAYIIPFAQQEMVYTFIEGINPSYNDLLRGYLEEMFEQYPRVLMESLSQTIIDPQPELLDVLQEQGRDMLEQLIKRSSEYRQKRLVNPIISIVALLPKDELAAMAESLVNLTSFKRRVSMETETVGGPIDVAVISKGDGFIWIKRKHYFDGKLNHHFFANYYNGSEGGRP